MADDNGYGPFSMRRRRGNALTHMLTAVLAAGLTVGLLLAFYSPAPGGSGGSSPGSDAVPAPAALRRPAGQKRAGYRRQGEARRRDHQHHAPVQQRGGVAQIIIGTQLRSNGQFLSTAS